MAKAKIVLIFCIILIASVSVATLVYFRYWREPEAIYLDTDNPKLIQIRKELKELKDGLREKGLYNCCIKNDCNWCAIYMGHCPCAQLVSEEGNEKSCPECTAAWNKKQGKFPGIDPDAIGITTFGIYGFKEENQHHGDHSEKD